MPELLFEIWADDPNEPGRGSMYLVHPQNDKARTAIQPNGILAHDYTATSSFEAFRIYHEWTGCGHWSPPSDESNHFFTEEEASEQREYLSRRNVR
jgi:hypothetical protein